MRHRHTRQREVILDIVRGTMDHPTAEWVLKQAKRRLPRISVGTVYRNLKELAAEGAIRELHTAGDSVRFDGNTGDHYHIRCVACGRLRDLPLSVDRQVEEEAARAINYRILGHQVEVLGVCPGCDAGAVVRPQTKNHSQQRPIGKV
jgi:Fur family ferric uptake transcriptional regulator